MFLYSIGRAFRSVWKRRIAFSASFKYIPLFVFKSWKALFTFDPENDFEKLSKENKEIREKLEETTKKVDELKKENESLLSPFEI